MLNLNIVRKVVSYITALLLVLLTLPSAAQSGDWDSALDRYESICNQCIRLRQMSLEGENVSISAFTDLLSQLSDLRNILQVASGQMSASQRIRFQSIRLLYANSGRETLTTLPQMDMSGVLSDAARISNHDFSSLTAPIPQYNTYLPEPSVLPLKPVIRPGVMVYAVLPDLQPGLMFRMDIGRYGFYVKGSVPVNSMKPDFYCKSDGTTDSGFIWTTGKEKTGHISVTAGGTLSLMKYLRLYAGAGYGKRSVLWEDASGLWAEVKDLSAPGLTIDAGLLLLDDCAVSLMVGVSTLSFRTLSLELGAGFCF